MNNKKSLWPLAVAVAALSLTSCQKNDSLAKFTANIERSILAVTAAEVQATVKDGSLAVYTLERSITLSDAEITLGTVTDTITVLTDGFDYKTETVTTDLSGSVKEATLFNFGLSKEYFETYEVSAGLLEATVKAEKASELFKINNFQATGAAKISVELNADKLSALTVTYKTESGKDVSVSAKYSY